MCRTANGYDINGLGFLKDGRGNACPVTVILPTLAMEVKVANPEASNEELEEKFMEYLDVKLHEGIEMLVERFEYMCEQPMESAKFMYENGLAAGYDGKDIRSALQHFTISLGFISIAETLEILVGENQCHPNGMRLAKRILQKFKDVCDETKKTRKLNAGVYYSPCENTCYTAMTKFREKYGIIPKVSDRPYFTNSIHVPVWEKMNAFEKIAIEAELCNYSSAGCIFYIENDNVSEDNIAGLDKIVQACLDADMPYIGLNSPNDKCNECGFLGIINSTCPECGSDKITRLRRVTGYITNDYKTSFNPGKQAEVADRVSHTTVIDEEEGEE